MLGTSLGVHVADMERPKRRFLGAPKIAAFGAQKVSCRAGPST